MVLAGMRGPTADCTIGTTLSGQPPATLGGGFGKRTRGKNETFFRERNKRRWRRDLRALCSVGLKESQ